MKLHQLIWNIRARDVTQLINSQNFQFIKDEKTAVLVLLHYNPLVQLSSYIIYPPASRFQILDSARNGTKWIESSGNYDEETAVTCSS